jgi:hypothetical protein
VDRSVEDVVETVEDVVDVVEDVVDPTEDGPGEVLPDREEPLPSLDRRRSSR